MKKFHVRVVAEVSVEVEDGQADPAETARLLVCEAITCGDRPKTRVRNIEVESLTPSPTHTKG